MQKPLVISFDLDGVLIQNPFGGGVFPWVRNHVRPATALQGLDVSEQDNLMNRTVNEEWAARMRTGDFAGAYDWDSILNTASAKLGGPAVPDVAGLVERFCLQEGMIALLPGALEGLELLRAAGATIHAITNGYRRFQLPVLQALGIDHYFSELVSPERVGSAKPQPGIFEAVPDLQVHVGDTLVHDIHGANQVGIRSIWLNPELPEGLRARHPDGRNGTPELDTLVEASLAASPYTRLHPEVTADTARPDWLVADALEAAETALAWWSSQPQPAG